MKKFIAVVLAIGCLSGIICIISACGDNSDTGYQTEKADTPYTEAATEKSVVFKGESINLEQYAALIAMYERISFEEIPIESDLDFHEIAVQWEQEELYSLHLFLSSLRPEEKADLFHLFLENV